MPDAHTNSKMFLLGVWVNVYTSITSALFLVKGESFCGVFASLCGKKEKDYP